jgi:hypothetical protein
MNDTDTQSKLAEYEGIIRLLTEKLKELVAENERLKAGLDAHSTLQSIYRNEAESSSTRIKAAAASLPHEVPRLTPEPRPLDLVGEEVVEPLASVVQRQRMRANRLLALSLEERSRLITGVGHGGNGQDDSSGD